jgi:hypothetical protein
MKRTAGCGGGGQAWAARDARGGVLQVVEVRQDDA